jgi:outer membrane protein assembly factor BamB
VFLTTAISSAGAVTFQARPNSNNPLTENVRHTWKVFALDKSSGRILWERTAHEGVPRVKRHMKGSHANSTPVTNGEYVAAVFDSEGLFVFDMKGNQVWKQDLGILDPGLHEDAAVQWGHASSPILHGNLVIVQCDGHAQSYLAAFDVKSGRQVWRTDRGERPSWSTPAVYQAAGRAELVTNAPRYIRGYDPATGKELWRFNNGDLVVQSPMPVIAQGLFLVGGGWPGGRPLKAFRAGARGDVSLKEGETAGAAVAWTIPKASAYVPTPLVYGEYVYVCNDRGVLSVYRLKTGEQVYQQRVNEQGAGFSASPVAGDGKLYLASEDGDVFVARAGPKYELLAANPMGEALMATPAISGGMIFVRGREHVFAVAAR